MTGVVVGALIVLGVWALFEWDQRRIERNADITPDPIFRAFTGGRSKW